MGFDTIEINLVWIVKVYKVATWTPNYYLGVDDGWFNSVVRLRLSQPPAGDWLVGAWAELGNKVSNIKYQISIIDYQILHWGTK